MWPKPGGFRTAQSKSAAFIDHQFALTYVLMGIVFVAAQGALGWLVWKYRDDGSNRKVEYSHGNTKLEVIWTTLTAILFVGLNLMGSHVWASERFEPAAAWFGPGGSDRHAVCLVLPLSRYGRQVRTHRAQTNGSLGRQRSRHWFGYR